MRGRFAECFGFELWTRIANMNVVGRRCGDAWLSGSSALPTGENERTYVRCYEARGKGTRGALSPLAVRYGGVRQFTRNIFPARGDMRREVSFPRAFVAADVSPLILSRRQG